jgi:hypothetical protein
VETPTCGRLLADWIVAVASEASKRRDGCEPQSGETKRIRVRRPRCVLGSEPKGGWRPRTRAKHTLFPTPQHAASNRVMTRPTCALLASRSDRRYSLGHNDSERPSHNDYSNAQLYRHHALARNCHCATLRAPSISWVSARWQSEDDYRKSQVRNHGYRREDPESVARGPVDPRQH